MKSRIQFLALPLLILILISGCNDEEEHVCLPCDVRTVSFTTVPDWHYFVIPDAGTLVITEEIDWLNLWNDYWTGESGGEKTAPPSIDFDTEMVIGVHYGVYTGCDNEAETIEFLILNEATLHVVIPEAPNLGFCDMIVYPIHLVKTSKRSVDVVFSGVLPE